MKNACVGVYQLLNVGLVCYQLV